MQRVTVSCKQLAECISSTTEEVTVIPAAKAQVIHSLRDDGERVRNYDDFLEDLMTNRIGTRSRMTANGGHRAAR